MLLQSEQGAKGRAWAAGLGMRVVTAWLLEMVMELCPSTPGRTWPLLPRDKTAKNVVMLGQIHPHCSALQMQ